MGFLSSLGSFCSSVGSAVSSAISSAGRMASSAFSAAKEYATKAISWMATKAESFMGNVSQMWQRVKPYIAKGRKILQFVGKVVKHPWVKTALATLDKALAFLENIDRSPLARKVEKALKWVIEWCKDAHQKQLEKAELEEARRHAAALAEAEKTLQGQERDAVSAMALLNNYMIVKAEVEAAVQSDTLQDFEYFLRLRAVQKLLAFYETRMEEVREISDIDADMQFLMFAANAMIAQDAEFSDEDTLRLDDLTTRKFGKPIIPFIFEEMITTWEKSRQILESEWENNNNALAKDQLLHNRLVRAQKYEELNADELKYLNSLKISLPQDRQNLEMLEDSLLARRNYVNAAEGFLQMLEKDEATLIDDGREYLLEQGAEIGQLLISCSQEERSWSDLSAEEQILITDFANIFAADCQKRTEENMLVEVAA